MKVLVTGADGFVGLHVTRALLERGHAVIGGIRGTPPSPADFAPPGTGELRWVTFDLRDGDSVRALVRNAAPEAVLHLAGVSSVSESWRDPETTFDVNATGTLRLLRGLAELPPGSRPRPVLLVSSGEVYGTDGTEERPLTEDLPLRPVTPYGASKAAQEMVADVLAGPDPGIRLVHARSFQQIGPGQRPTFVTVNWARQLLEIRAGGRDPVLQVGNLDIDRDFLDVRDGAAAYAALLEEPRAEGVYNVCSGRSCSLRQLLELLQEVVGVRVEVATEPARLRPAEIRSLVGSHERLAADTGWRPARPIEESLRTLVDSLDRSLRHA